MSSGPTHDESGRTASPTPGAPSAHGFDIASLLFTVGGSFGLARLIVRLPEGNTILMFITGFCMFGGVFFMVRARRRSA